MIEIGNDFGGPEYLGENLSIRDIRGRAQNIAADLRSPNYNDGAKAWIKGPTMNQLSKIELQVEEATAAALADPHRREAVSRLVDRLVRPGTDDPLIALLNCTAAEAAASGLTQPDAEAEPAAHKAEATPTHTSQHVRLTRDGVLQTVHIPQAFELPGTEATITQQGDRLIIEPIRKRGLAALLDSWEDIDEDFPEIEDPPPEPEDIF